MSIKNSLAYAKCKQIKLAADTWKMTKETVELDNELYIHGMPTRVFLEKYEEILRKYPNIDGEFLSDKCPPAPVFIKY